MTQVIKGLRNVALGLCPQSARKLVSQEVTDSSSKVTGRLVAHLALNPHYLHCMLELGRVRTTRLEERLRVCSSDT